MTNTEIIEKLKGYKGIIMYPTDEAEALKDMAIQALSQEPCDDAISRDAVNTLVDELARAISDERCHIPQRGRDTGHIMHDILDLPSVTQKSGWIPVSERLPEEREWYLAVFKEKDTAYQLIPRVVDYIGKSENKWQIIDEEGLCQEYRDTLECIAWMPLPKPYEPQESEDKE